MAIELIHIGKQAKNIFSQAELEYIKRIKRYTRFNNLALKPLKNAAKMDKTSLLREEANMMKNRLKNVRLCFLLDENGKQYNSKEFAKFIENSIMHSGSIAFCIGGAYGFDPQFKKESNGMIALSKMTMPHHLARLVFLEQLYRAFTIIHHEPYHNE